MAGKIAEALNARSTSSLNLLAAAGALLAIAFSSDLPSIDRLLP
jgi:hypothetical protein